MTQYAALGAFGARRAATIERLVGFGIPRDQTIRWIELYEVEHNAFEKRYAPTFWDDAYEKILAAYVAGERPPPRPE